MTMDTLKAVRDPFGRVLCCHGRPFDCNECGEEYAADLERPAAPTAPQPPAGEDERADVLRDWEAEIKEHGVWTSGHSIGCRMAALLRAASVSGEAESLPTKVEIVDEVTRHPRTEPTYRALKDEAGHWKAECKVARIREDAAERRADALRTELDKCLEAWRLRDKREEGVNPTSIAEQLRRLPIDVAAGEPATVVVPLDLLEMAANAINRR